MDEHLSLQATQKEWYGTYRDYAIGLVGSILITCIAFFLVYAELLPKNVLIYTLPLLALVQAAVQLRYFLHLGEEAHPRWESLVFFFMFIILVVIVAGTLYIMYDLDVRMMQGMEM